MNLDASFETKTATLTPAQKRPARVGGAGVRVWRFVSNTGSKFKNLAHSAHYWARMTSAGPPHSARSYTGGQRHGRCVCGPALMSLAPNNGAE